MYLFEINLYYIIISFSHFTLLYHFFGKTNKLNKIFRPHQHMQSSVVLHFSRCVKDRFKQYNTRVIYAYIVSG